MGILKTLHRAHDLHLNVKWQAGGNPFRIQVRRGANPLRLDKDLVRVLSAKRMILSSIDGQ